MTLLPRTLLTRFENLADTLGFEAFIAELFRFASRQGGKRFKDPLPITASFGVASAWEGPGFEDAFRRADKALYQAKGCGRNCVVGAKEEQMHTMTGARKGTWAIVTGRFRLHK